MDKSYVTLELCPICQKETGTILMDRHLRDKFEMHTINPTNPCDNCKEKYLKDGVLIINPETCRLVVLTVDAFKRVMNIPVPKKHICFAHDDVLDQLSVQ